MVIDPITTARVGTRGSSLARAQTALACNALQSVHPSLNLVETVIRTTGDDVIDAPLPTIASGASGVFTSAIEASLLSGVVDLAVHSAKDLPTDVTSGLVLGAYLPRANVRDVLISREGYTLAALPDGAIVGTSSPRRAAQLIAARPDLIIRDLRGNIDTRIGKAIAADGDYDAIVLARAGLDRLERGEVITETLPLEVMLPAPAQGAIVVQVREDADWIALVTPINDADTQDAVSAERAFLRGLGGGCALPVAAYAHTERDTLYIRGRVLTRDGTQRIDVDGSFDRTNGAEHAGLVLAERALDAGARRLITEDGR